MRDTELVTDAPIPAADSVPKSIGTRTAADLSHGDAPPQLADPFLTAEGATIIFGRGGIGKGLVACVLAMRLVQAGHIVMIIDFEGHEREWGSRLRGLGLTDDELRRVHYRAPSARDWTAPKGTLHQVQKLVDADCIALGVTYLVIDSYTVATSSDDSYGGQAAAQEYFDALARLTLPSLTIAHVRGDSGRFPDRPFGSVFVHNLARETWAVEAVDDERDTDPDLIQFGPSVVSLELRPKKMNSRRRPPAQTMTFSFYGDGTIGVADGADGVRSIADLAADVLAEEPMTLPKAAAAIFEDTGQRVTAESLRVVLKRDPRRFAEQGGKRPRAWALR